MFTRDEASRVRKEFWTVFGKYMSPVPSSEGMKINWVNYHTRVKDVYFRMDAGVKAATISISLEHSDDHLRELHFDQLSEFKSLLHDTLGETWEWDRENYSSSKLISRVFRELPDVSVLRKEQWPDLISFFKPRIIALDQFWENAKYSFENLR